MFRCLLVMLLVVFKKSEEFLRTLLTVIWKAQSYIKNQSTGSHIIEFFLGPSTPMTSYCLMFETVTVVWWNCCQKWHHSLILLLICSYLHWKCSLLKLLYKILNLCNGKIELKSVKYSQYFIVEMIDNLISIIWNQ